ncbi:triose-phosphate isomerase [Caulobacter sp. NIBR2454]|uniref:triose-phosphate isomerase n=1 Tax=Caulobacter sp. NIBR2454 TaxID=3015996 RepID=UPI0022B6E1DA|nr:triose-phosphate isomerase [Caulobacter sp. NIBR2454]
MSKLTTVRPLIAGNWKMNGLTAALDEARAVAAGVETDPPGARVAIFPPATLIHRMADALAGQTVAVGGQDCRPEVSGAFTGDTSAEMLADAGATMVIVGHSERRGGYGETDALVLAKAQAALRAGLEPIVCVGESLEQRDAGRAIEVITGQLRASLPVDALKGEAFAVAYEPVWAIGTGRTPTLNDIEAAHDALRTVLIELFSDQGAGVPILYGGSVNPKNAADILSQKEVGGVLVGGASLKAADFLAIAARA